MRTYQDKQKVKSGIKAHVKQILIEEHNIDEPTAHKMVNESIFSQMLKISPFFVSHYGSDYWVKEILNEYENK